MKTRIWQIMAILLALLSLVLALELSTKNDGMTKIGHDVIRAILLEIDPQALEMRGELRCIATQAEGNHPLLFAGSVTWSAAMPSNNVSWLNTWQVTYFIGDTRYEFEVVENTDGCRYPVSIKVS